MIEVLPACSARVVKRVALERSASVLLKKYPASSIQFFVFYRRAFQKALRATKTPQKRHRTNRYPSA
jgi:hypothetical protein